jgi:hypothetical protein
MSEYKLVAQISESAQIQIQTETLNELAQALVFFNLATPAAQRDGVAQAPAPVAEEPKAKKSKAAKAATSPDTAETAAASETKTPASDTSDTTPSASANGADEGNAAAAGQEAETVAAPAASSAGSSQSTPAQAAEAVRAYGAKHGIAAARELLQKFGFAKTADITADKAGEVVTAASV